MNTWRTTTKQIIFSVTLFSLCTFGASFALGDWTVPASSAPTCTSGNPGCDAPLNVTSTGQTKLGGLTLNTGGAPNGLIVASGKTALGTVTPNASAGLTVANATGHGIVATGISSGATYYGVYGQSGSYYGALGRADGYSIVGNGAAYFSGTGYFGSSVNLASSLVVGSTAVFNGASFQLAGPANSNGNRALCFSDSNNSVHPAVGSCTVPSDIRLKENITDTPSMLDLIRQIRVVNFDLKSDPDHQKTTGVIAQELYKVLPYMVSVGGDSATSSPWGVHYDQLGIVALKGVQELQVENDSLRADLNQLRKEFEAYKAAH
jgi:hypothetical protein